MPERTKLKEFEKIKFGRLCVWVFVFSGNDASKTIITIDENYNQSIHKL